MSEIRDRPFVHPFATTNAGVDARAEVEELRARERQLRLVTDALPVLVAFVGPDYRYQFVNAAYERWFGRPRADLIGHSLQEVWGTVAFATVRPYVDRALAGEPVSFDAEVPCAAGSRRVSASYFPQREGERVTGFVSFVRDVMAPEPLAASARDHQLQSRLALADAMSAENSRLQLETEAARNRDEQLYRFAHAAASSEKLEQVFDAAFDAIERALGTPRAAILLCDETGTMRFRAWRELSDEYRSAVEGHSPWPKGASAPEPVIVPDVTRDASLAAFGPLFARERIGSLAFIPLATRGRLLGKLMVYHDEPHHYSTTEIELAFAIANHLASVSTRFMLLAELERTVHDNEMFAGVLAHDLRNPLGAIMTAAQVLLMRQDGEGARSVKPLSRILASGQRMSRMIDQLLDFTRARVGGGIEIRPRDANLADLCNQAVGELELIYPERRIERQFAGDLRGWWDADRVLQIVSNLVANASQHGLPDSAITVRADGTSSEGVVLEVHNQGAVPPELLPKLFHPFRGTYHRRDHSRGLGLGLYIVKELARAHGGSVEVASSEAAGTTFTVRLPRLAVRD